MFSTTSRTLLTALAMLLGVCFVSGLAFTTPQASAAKDDKKKDRKNRNKKNDKDDDKKTPAAKKKPSTGPKKPGEKEEVDIEDFDGLTWNQHKRGKNEVWGIRITVSGDSTNIPVRKGNTFFDCHLGNVRRNRADEYQPPFLMEGGTTRRFKSELAQGGGWNKYVFSFWTRRTGKVYVGLWHDAGWDITKFSRGDGGGWVSFADVQIDGIIKKTDPAYMTSDGWQTWADNMRDERERPQIIVDKNAPGGKYFRHWRGLHISLDVPKSGPENEVIVSFYARSEGVYPPRTYEEYRRDFGDEKFKKAFGEKFFNQKFGGGGN